MMSPTHILEGELAANSRFRISFPFGKDGRFAASIKVSPLSLKTSLIALVIPENLLAGRPATSV